MEARYIEIRLYKVNLVLSAGNTYHDFMKINCRKTCGMDTGKTAELITFLAGLNKSVC